MDKVESTLQVLTEANELLAAHAALVLRVRSAQQIHRMELKELDSPPSELLKLPLIPSPSTPPSDDEESRPSSPVQQRAIRQDLAPAKRARAQRYLNYVPEEETIRNDYSQRYVDSGEWPQNWVLGAEPERRFEEYPKQKRLLDLKKAAVNQHTVPPTYLPFSDLTILQPSKFDVILLDPPFSSKFTWDHLQELPVPLLASDPSFVFLWVGSGAGEGLERGREILAKWGYRRCEDVVWIKTNKTTNQGPGTDPPTTSLFTRTKQHCLMGIRGTVRRSTDSWFVHCNVDTDVIIWEGDPSDPTRKPPEMYTLIENFCLGLRRLEIFGKRSSLRRGWVTVLTPGQEDAADGQGNIPVDASAFAVSDGGGGAVSANIPQPMVATRWLQSTWDEGIKELSNAGSITAMPGGGGSAAGMGGPMMGIMTNRAVVPMTAEIDALRPKSPVRGGHPGGGQGSGGGSSGGNNHTPSGSMSGSMGGGMAMPMGMNMGMGMGGLSGGVAMGINPMNATAPRFSASNRGHTGMGGPPGMGGFGGNHPMMGVQNQMAVQMGGMGNPMGNMGMGGMNDEMMGNWNPMMAGMGGMNVNPMNVGMGGGMGMGAVGMQSGGMNMGAGVGNNRGGIGMQGMPMQMMNQMGMPNQNAFQAMQGGGMQAGAGNPAGFVGMGHGQMFNNNMNSNWAGDQGQFSGMDGVAWDETQNMNGINQGMNPMGMGIGQQHWGSTGNF